MKKTLIMIALLQVMYSCSSKEKKTTEDANKNEVGVQNNNGGIPDTTNTINLSTHKKDTTQKSKDSMK